jgi:DNA-binding NtrC family response regulator
MSAPPAKILLVEDDAQLAAGVQAVLESRGHEVHHVEDGDFAIDLLDEAHFDVIVSDLQMPVMSGMEVLEEVRKKNSKLPVIMITAHSTTDRAIEATRKGAFDYLVKPFEMPDLLDAVEKAARTSRLTAKAVTLGEEVPDKDALIGASRKMQAVFKDIGKYADKPIPMLLRGETGVGKELVARAIYHHGSRANKPFVAVNCAAIPDTLIESELFGHERGAFTNAVARRIGRFEQAHGGTLFLDEIGDLPWETQVKLLRVLQEKVITRVGSKEEIPVDVRIISASLRDLEQMIADGKFREDLFYRLNAVEVSVPALRERREDIPALTSYFLAKYAREFELEPPGIHKKAVTLLEEHDWPGNVRQLENVIRKALVDCRGLPISADLVEEALRKSAPRPCAAVHAAGTAGAESPLAQYVHNRLLAASRGELAGAFGLMQEDLEREIYRQAVELSHGHQTNIAKWLGVSRLTVREKLDKYELFPKRGSGRGLPEA